MASKELAPAEDQGIVLGIVEAAADATMDQTTFYTDAINREFGNMPEKDADVSTHHARQRLLRHGAQAVGRTQTHGVSDPAGGASHGEPDPRHPDGSRPRRPRCPAAAISRWNSSSPPPPSRSRFWSFAQQMQQKAAASGMFAFPPMIDTKMDQPEVELVLDRDKVAALGLDMATVGSDLAALVGGNYVNRFDFAGRSYKVIPQLKRIERMNADQLENNYVKGPNGQLMPVSTFAHSEKHTTPRALNRFQQLNSVKISGVAICPLDQALKFLETESAKILPQGYKLDYTGESRQLRVEGNKFLPAFMLALVLIFLVLAAQFNSFRDPLIILLGSVPLAMFGALMFCFLKMPDPDIPFFTNGWTTTLNIYSQVGLVTLVGLVSKNGILIVQFANELQRRGRTKIQAVREAAISAAARADDQRGHGGRPFPAHARHRRGRGRAQFHRHRACRGHGAGHAVHAAGDSLDLHSDRQTARRGDAKQTPVELKLAPSYQELKML